MSIEMLEQSEAVARSLDRRLKRTLINGLKMMSGNKHSLTSK